MYQLKLTEQDKQFVLNEAMQYFASKLNNSRGADSIDFSYKIKRVVPVDIAKTTLYIYERAFTKMAMYVMDNRTEIGWHGLARKLENNEGYAITDTLLYPQVITATTVNTDQKKYQDWLNAQPDEIFNQIKMQGHSHVSMSVSPSTVDETLYNTILQTLQENDFYIFMIVNKSLEMHVLIYDLAKNLVYETADIDIKICDPNTKEELNTEYAVEKQKYLANQSVPTYRSSYGTCYKDYYSNNYDDYYDDYPSVYGGGYVNTTKSTKSTKSTKPSKSSKPKYIQSDLDDYLDELEKKFAKQEKKA